MFQSANRTSNFGTTWINNENIHSVDAEEEGEKQEDNSDRAEDDAHVVDLVLD